MPAVTPLINGINYAWANISFVLFGVPVIGITKINYKVKQKKENNYGAGIYPISRGYGQEEYEGDIELYTDELKRIITSSVGRDLNAIPMFDITVLFSGAGLTTDKDILRSCEFTEQGLSAALGDTKLLVSLPLIIGSVER